MLTSQSRQNAVLLSIFATLGVGYFYFRSQSMSEGISGVKANAAKGGSTGSIGSGAADSKREESLQIGKN